MKEQVNYKEQRATEEEKLVQNCSNATSGLLNKPQNSIKKLGDLFIPIIIIIIIIIIVSIITETIIIIIIIGINK